MDKEVYVTEIDQARKLIEQDQRQRVRLCQEAIQQALQQHNCELVAALQTNLGTLAVPIEIRAK